MATITNTVTLLPTSSVTYQYIVANTAYKSKPASNLPETIKLFTAGVIYKPQYYWS